MFNFRIFKLKNNMLDFKMNFKKKENNKKKKDKIKLKQ